MEPKFFEGEDNVLWWVMIKPGHLVEISDNTLVGYTR
jgi:hypothetical protein